MEKPIIYAVDAHAFLHRAYHALPKLTASDGQEVGALYGFAKLIIKILREKTPQYMAVCFDSPEKTFRHEIYPEYKANRKKTDPALVGQLKLARGLIEAMGIKVFSLSGFEADDLLSAISQRAKSQGFKTVLVASDKDSFQLLNEDVSIWQGNETSPRGPDIALEKFGLPPERLADYFALVGDSSDNVSGIEGVGPKTALKLLQEHANLEDIIEKAKLGQISPPALAAKIRNKAEQAVMSKKLVTLDGKIPAQFEMSDFKVNPPKSSAITDVFKKYGFKNVAEHFALSMEIKTTAPLKWEELLKKLPSCREFFIAADENFVSLGVDSEQACMAPLEISVGDKEILRKLILNPDVAKIGHDIKSALRYLNINLGDAVKINCFDTALAAYCLNPAAAGFGFGATLWQYLGEMVPPGGADKLLLENHFIWRLKDKLSSELKEKGLWELFDGLEMPLMAILWHMEKTGVSIDPQTLNKIGHDLKQKIESLQAEIDELSGMPINPNSPKQMAFLLFEKLGVPALRKIKTGFSTDEEVLSKIAHQYPVAQKIIDYREAAKLKSTYIDGLLPLVHTDGRLHTHFIQTGTSTGRLASAKPNLQNIPVRAPLGRLVRQAFSARTGCTLLSADYSQIDLRVLAHESGDKKLLDAFSQGGDIHSKTAAEVFGVMPGMVSDEMRFSAKAINFGIIYGQTAMGLSQALNISRDEAQKYINHYFKTYSDVKKWIDETIIRSRESGFVKTFFGRLRPIVEFKSGAGAAFAQRVAVNAIIQGGSADIIKKAMLDIYDFLRDKPAKMILQVHDELLFEIEDGQVETIAPVLAEKMANAVKLKVPLVVDLKAGKNWQDMQKLK
ncbi:MAG: DNA polymerase I [Elusimicrobia bacterium]|nr:DNA polymerase I [Elusimicrobiota bacterium]